MCLGKLYVFEGLCALATGGKVSLNLVLLILLPWSKPLSWTVISHERDQSSEI
jgi:hypothetical protein